MTPSRRTTARGPVDWAELRRRLDDVHARAVAGASPEQIHELLRERARTLARPLGQETTADTLEIVTFSLGAEHCGIESRFVLEVLGRARFTPLPRVAPPAIGVTGWRGDVLTVMDLRLLLSKAGLAPADGDQPEHVMVIGDGTLALGVVVTGVGDIDRVRLAALQPAGAESERPCLRGITPEAVSIFDGAALIRQLTEGAPL